MFSKIHVQFILGAKCPKWVVLCHLGQLRVQLAR